MRLRTRPRAPFGMDLRQVGQELRDECESHWVMHEEQKVWPQGVMSAWGEQGGMKQLG